MQADNMRKPRLILLTVVILFFFTGLTLLADSSPESREGKAEQEDYKEITWHRYDDGIKLAKENDKHVFIDFSTSWCTWCKKMDKETFTEPEVVRIVNDHFIAIKVDGDSREMLDIDGYKISEQNLTKKEFGVNGFPAFWFLKPDGTKLALIRGYRPAKDMMEAFTFIKERRYDTTSTNERADKKK